MYKPPSTNNKAENTRRNPNTARGKRGADTAAAAQATQAAATTPQNSNPQINATKYRITMSNCTVSMFPDCKMPKNRRMTPKEKEEELFISKLFKRPPRDFILDHPFYPYVPAPPKGYEHVCVNFDLNYP